MHTSALLIPRTELVADEVTREVLSLFVFSGVIPILLLDFFCESTAVSRGTCFSGGATEG